MKIDSTVLIALICKTLSARFRSDPSKPSVVISHLNNGIGGSGEPTWYVAANRFKGAFGTDKERIAWVTDTDLDDAIFCLAQQFVDDEELQVELRKAVECLRKK